MKFSVLHLKFYIFYIYFPYSTLAFDSFSYLSTIGSAFKKIGKVVVGTTVCNVVECCSDTEIPADFNSELTFVMSTLSSTKLEMAYLLA